MNVREREKRNPRSSAVTTTLYMYVQSKHQETNTREQLIGWTTGDSVEMVLCEWNLMATRGSEVTMLLYVASRSRSQESHSMLVFPCCSTQALV